MIKQLGTIGFNIKFNESASTSFKFLEIFSSSAANSSLFSASTNSVESVSLSSNSASYYKNGIYASTTYSNEWVHMTFVFSPKLETDSANNFLVRFGNQDKSNFNIQNLYILDTTLSSNEVNYLYYEFVGGYTFISAGDTASPSIKVLDKYDGIHTSSITNTVYQAYQDQLKFKYDVNLVTELSASLYVSTEMIGDTKFFDGHQIQTGNRLLSLADNKIYTSNANNKLIEDTTVVNGDYIHVLCGQEYSESNFIKLSSSFIQTTVLDKVIHSLSNSN